ncbi:hypothetical protein MPNB_4410 [Mycoplasmoides pneumoniae]|uniref:Uncharacterized protein n=1 Tax=Mycoplasmoides pneumoniae 309 TaxID=1112856 RepID=A0AB33HPQ4_MYCPM|nr:hypothetical protein MPNA4410 [Mycoplasmoides pneumoniae 309]BAV19941.1 hypothetical protein MPNB_4410 [Mycoplasmoides pneumoniae]BAV20679.1 hypothetical protein MPNC_4410 [Mycoplasmoides pneumoniae]
MLSTAAKSAASNWSTMLVASTTFLVSLVSDKLNGKSITWPLSVPRTYLVRPSFLNSFCLTAILLLLWLFFNRFFTFNQLFSAFIADILTPSNFIRCSKKRKGIGRG